ncbi:hypothetical protein [Campylobacter fetus]|uniref:hypothetical protein n=1 Tax=Campylobacter fetus TaxID=196 RepID=UPI00163C5551|nr:hypothetical protein [Campylobacter fetus]
MNLEKIAFLYIEVNINGQKIENLGIIIDELKVKALISYIEKIPIIDILLLSMLPFPNKKLIN